MCLPYRFQSQCKLIKTTQLQYQQHITKTLYYYALDSLQECISPVIQYIVIDPSRSLGFIRVLR